VYISSLTLMALYDERVRAAERQPVHPARRWQQPARTRRRLALRTRTRAGKAGLLAAGAKP
jgi:hypothetical protein